MPEITNEITNADIIQSWAGMSREAIESHGDDGDFARQHLLNPAIFMLLGDVQNRHILDAGCGQGYLCRLLAKKGALVTGIEPAENLYRYAVERERSEPLGITYRQEDLSSLQDLRAAFDCVIANMVFIDIPDYQTAIRNCIASLKPGGHFIFSITHPCFEESAATWGDKGYVEVREYLREFAVKSNYGYQFHRPLSAYLNLMIRSGCALQRIIEPQLSEKMIQDNPATARNIHVPQFLIAHAIKA